MARFFSIICTLPVLSLRVGKIWIVIFLICLSGINVQKVFAAPAIQNASIPSLSTRQGLSQDTINDILIDNTGFVWIATQGGLDRWDGHHLITIGGPDNLLINASIEKLFLDAKNRLWISTLQSGVFTLDLTTSQVEQQLKRPGLDIYDWVQSASDFASDEKGWTYVALDHEVVRMDSDLVQQEIIYTLPERLRNKEEIIRSIHLTRHYLYVATSDGLYAMKRGSEKNDAVKIDYLSDIAENVDNRNTKFLLVDTRQRFWVATVRGLFMTDLNQLESALVENRETEFLQVVPDQNVWEMHVKKDGSFWLATDNGLLSLDMSSPGNWTTVHMLEAQNGDTQLAKAKISVVTEDKLGTLWLGTDMGGVMLWTPQNQNITHIQNIVGREDSPLTDNIIWSMYQDDEGALWAGTDNGLTRLDLISLDSRKFLDYADGADFDAAISQVLPADEDHLYIGNYSGVRLFDKQSGKLMPVPTQNAGDAEIMAGWIYGMALDSQGRLYFLSHRFYRYDFTTRSLEELKFDHPKIKPSRAWAFLGTSQALNGDMLLSTQDGVWQFDPVTLTPELLYEYQPTERTSDAAVTSWTASDGLLWLGFPRFGLIGIELESKRVVKRFNSDNLLKTDITYGVQADAQGSLWFSSHQGVFRFMPDSRLISSFVYGREINVSEFNDNASVMLNDGRIAYGSTGGIVIFDPAALSAGNGSERVKQPMVISEVSLDSRSLGMPMTNLSQAHLDLNHDDFGIEIHFSSTLASFDAADNYVYELTRNGRMLSQSITSQGKAAFAFLGPGDYVFKVAPTTERYGYEVTPGKLTFSIPHPPFRSPLAYTIYVLLILTTFVAYMFWRQREIKKVARTERRLRVMGEAFNQTRDWVIVFDEQMRPMAVNPSFCRALGLAEDEAADHALAKLYRRNPAIREQLYEPLLAMEPGGFLKRETTFDTVDGGQHDVIIDTTAVADDKSPESIDYYLMVFSDVSEQKEAERKLVKMASYDSLTGLLNRNLLVDRLSHAIANATEDSSRVAVLFIDLDRFKGINDSLGHEMGDKLLKVVAARMVSLASQQDTVARLGGDEFVIVRERIACTNSLSSFVAHLIETVETPIAIDNELLCISCSIGISLYPDDSATPSDLIKQADVAMYCAKKDGVDGFAYFTAEMNERAKEQMTLENRVKLAYQEGRFYNHYQPIMDTESGSIEGIELLLRCDMPDAPMVPGEFIPVLEELRYIVDVTRMAIVRALDDLAQWQQNGFHGYVSVNISALQFKAELHLSTLRTMMYQRNLTERSMRFEITEGLLMEDSKFAQERIREFQDAGFLFSLDDFGTGYSSLSYLRKFPVDVLKIDKSFIEGIEKDAQAAALVKTTIELAKTFNMECVAEGVETESQAETLQLFGCYNHQGFYYSKPVEADQITAMIQQNWSANISR